MERWQQVWKGRERTKKGPWLMADWEKTTKEAKSEKPRGCWHWREEWGAGSRPGGGEGWSEWARPLGLGSLRHRPRSPGRAEVRGKCTL